MTNIKKIYKRNTNLFSSLLKKKNNNNNNKTIWIPLFSSY